MKVLSTSGYQRATKKAVVEVAIGEYATYDEVIDFGLAGLGETRNSTFGYGIDNHPPRAYRTCQFGAGRYTVYADVD